LRPLQGYLYDLVYAESAQAEAATSERRQYWSEKYDDEYSL
jgi:hypothetical protein